MIKGKPAIFRYLGIASVFFIAFLYLALYFLPTVKTINRLKRDQREAAGKVADFQRTAGRFAFPDRLERDLTAAAREELAAMLPLVSDREEEIARFNRLCGAIQAAAREEKIDNLIIASTSRELDMNARLTGTATGDPAGLLAFVAGRLASLETKKEEAAQTPPPARPQLAEQTAVLAFSAELPQSMAFLKKLAWLGTAAGPGRVVIEAAPGAPRLLVELRGRFLDGRKPDAQQ